MTHDDSMIEHVAIEISGIGADPRYDHGDLRTPIAVDLHVEAALPGGEVTRVSYRLNRETAFALARRLADCLAPDQSKAH